jgi:hypothetical protein
MGKLATASDWKAIQKKFSVVADNGLSKALATYEQLAGDKHQERLNALESIDSIARKLKTVLLDGIKTAKANKAKPEVAKNLTAVIDQLTTLVETAEAEQKQIKDEVKKLAAATEAAQPPILDRLVAAAETISGAPGNRLRKVMAIAAKAGSSSYKSLWFYNSYAVFEFVNFNAKQSKREELIKAGGGKLPYKGDTWVVYPFTKKLAGHCPQGCPDKNLVTFLKSLDDDILTSLDPMFKAQATDAASAFGPAVNEFIKHVGKLASDKGHLYSAGY